jgi:hypothetical protein
VVLRWHAYRYLGILLGYFRDVFQINVSDEDFHSANIKPKGDGHILDDHCMSTCKHVKF